MAGRPHPIDQINDVLIGQMSQQEKENYIHIYQQHYSHIYDWKTTPVTPTPSPTQLLLKTPIIIFLQTHNSMFFFQQTTTTTTITIIILIITIIIINFFIIYFLVNSLYKPIVF